MKKWFQNHTTFYATVIVLAIFLQWLVSRAFDADIREADQPVENLIAEYKNEFDKPGSVPLGDVREKLLNGQKNIAENYKKLKEQVSFSVSPDYSFEPKDVNPSVVSYLLKDKRERFHARNEKRIKGFPANKFTASFNATSFGIDVSVDRLSEYMLQMSIVEELLNRLDLAGVLPLVESISASLPRSEMGSAAASTNKMIKKSLRYPVQIELSGDLLSLDKFLNALRAGKGIFFVDELEFQHPVEVLKWSDKVRCKLSLSALSMEVESNIFF